MSYVDMGNHRVTVAACAWSNGEGWDIAIGTDGPDADRVISLSDEELRAVNAAVLAIEYGEGR